MNRNDEKTFFSLILFMFCIFRFAKIAITDFFQHNFLKKYLSMVRTVVPVIRNDLSLMKRYSTDLID